jgi:acyl-CoA thioester hydrolase
LTNVFRHQLRVRYSECDPQGVVFNANYLEYYDVAMTEFHRELIGPYSDLVDGGLEMVVAETTLRFLGSAGFDDQLDLEVQVTRLGVTSLGTSLKVRKDDDVIVEGSMRYVFVDRTTKVKKPVPDAVRERLEPFLVDTDETSASGFRATDDRWGHFKRKADHWTHETKVTKRSSLPCRLHLAGS